MIPDEYCLCGEEKDVGKEIEYIWELIEQEGVDMSGYSVEEFTVQLERLYSEGLIKRRVVVWG